MTKAEALRELKKVLVRKYENQVAIVKEANGEMMKTVEKIAVLQHRIEEMEKDE